jgi:hypothetical protein
MTRREEAQNGHTFRTLHPSGRLVFLIETSAPSKFKLKREWSDSEARRLEDAIPEIIETLLATGTIIAELQRQREDDHRRYQEEMMMLRKQEEQQKLDDSRWAVLLEFASRAEKIPQLERLLDDLEAAAGDLEDVVGDRTLREWLAWCRWRCQELDPRRRSLQAIFESVAKANPYRS